MKWYHYGLAWGLALAVIIWLAFLIHTSDSITHCEGTYHENYCYDEYR